MFSKHTAEVAICVIKFSLVLLFSSVANANDASYSINKLHRADESTINYYLQQNSFSKYADVLLLVLHGSDCNSVTNISSVNEVFSRVWPTADVLTVEKYGINNTLAYSADSERPDCPALYLQHDSPRQRAADIDLVLKYILENTHPYQDIVLLGGSEGAVVANLINSELSQIAAKVLFNGGGRWFIDDVLHSMVFQFESEKELVDAKLEFKSFADHVLSSEPFQLNVSGHGFSWWRNVLEIDQQNILEHSDVPTLIVQSGRDEAVSHESVGVMVSELRALGMGNIEYVRYDHLDHGLKSADGVSEASRVVDEARVWLKNKLWERRK